MAEIKYFNNDPVVFEGEVGIGTTSPSSLLHVKTSNDNTGAGITVGVGLDNGSASTPNALDLQNVGGTTTDAVAANFKVGGTDRAKIIGGRYSNGGYLKIQTGNTSNTLTDRITIDNNGDVSIGATTKLTGYSGTFRTLSIQTPSGDNASILELAGNRNANPGNQNAMIQFFNKTGTATEVGRISSLQGSDVTSGSITFNTNDSGTFSEKVRIQSDGNVGIGTVSPTTNLHVAGPAYFEGGTISFSDTVTNAGIVIDEGDYIYTRDGNNLRRLIGKESDVVYVGQAGTSLVDEIRLLPGVDGPVTFYSGSSEYARFDAGRLGIGTTSPSAKLEVAGKTIIGNSFTSGAGVATDYINILVGSNSTGKTNGITFWENLTSTFGMSIGYNGVPSGDDNQINIYNTSSSPIVSFNNGGNVGIGTTNPAGLLSLSKGTRTLDIKLETTPVSGDVGVQLRAGDGDYLGLAAGGGSSVGLVVDSSNNVGIGTTSPTEILEVSGSMLAGKAGVASRYKFRRPSDGNSTAAYVGYNTADNIDFGIYNGSGGGGIKLSSNNGNFDFYNTNTSTNLVRIESTGDVGIGTASPGAHLHIYGAGDEMLRLADSSTTGQPYISFYQTTTRRSFIQHVDSGDNLKLSSEYGGIEFHTGTGGAEAFRMAIDSGGNVGIGSVSPVYKLDVAGDTRSNALWFRANTTTSPSSTAGFYRPELGAVAYGYDGSERMRITPAGNVGIGITNPSSKLYVGGDSLGTSSGDQKFNTLFSNSVTNAEVLEIKSVRTAAGSDWTTAGKRIQMKIDSTWMGYMQFNGSGNNQGITFGAGSTTTSPGNVPERMRIRQGGDISFRDTSNNEKFYWDASAGSLGIGETSPASPLSIEFADSSTTQQLFKGLILANSNSTTNNGAVIAFPYGGSSSNSFARIGAIHTDRTGGSESTDLFFGTLHSGAYSEKMRIDSSGNVGIGTTNPTFKLHISNSTGGNGSYTGGILIDNTGTDTGESVIAFKNAGTNGTGTNFWWNGVNQQNFYTIGYGTSVTDGNTKLVIDETNGNVGIGTVTPAENLHVYGAAPTIRLTDTGNPINYNINATSTKLQFSVESSEKLIIESGGDVGIGVSAASYKLHVGGDTLISDSLGVGVNPNATNGRIDASNDVVAYSTSDIRLKENQHEIIDAVGKITRLKGITFDWKEFEGVQEIHGNKGRDVGVIAQEVEEVLPEVVTTRDNGYKAVKYEKLTPLLIQGIKELKQQNDSLRKELDELKDTVNKLR